MLTSSTPGESRVDEREAGRADADEPHAGGGGARLQVSHVPRSSTSGESRAQELDGLVGVTQL